MVVTVDQVSLFFSSAPFSVYFLPALFIPFFFFSSSILPSFSSFLPQQLTHNHHKFTIHTQSHHHHHQRPVHRSFIMVGICSALLYLAMHAMHRRFRSSRRDLTAKDPSFIARQRQISPALTAEAPMPAKSVLSSTHHGKKNYLLCRIGADIKRPSLAPSRPCQRNPQFLLCDQGHLF